MRSHPKALFVVALLLAFLAFGSSASAVVNRPFDYQLTEAGGSQFSAPWALAVDGSDSIWLSDPGLEQISKFAPNGDFLDQGIGEDLFVGDDNFSAVQNMKRIAFSDASDHLYVGDPDSSNEGNPGIWVLNSDLTFNSLIDYPASGSLVRLSTAADNSGTATDGALFATQIVGSGESAQAIAVLRLDGAGGSSNFSGSAPYIDGNRLIGTPDHSFGKVDGIAVDQSNGDIYVLDVGNSEVDQFDSEGIFVKAFTVAFDSMAAIAVDPTTHNLLVADTDQDVVHELDSSGTAVRVIDGSVTPNQSFDDPNGIAADSTGHLYVSDSGHHVVVRYGPAAELPGVVTTAASAASFTAATLNGSVDPDSIAILDCKFEYGPTRSYGSVAPCDVDPGSGSEPIEVSADIVGLTPRSLYHFRLAASNGNGANYGKDVTFSTGPEVTTLPAAAVTDTTAILGGKVDPNGDPTSYYVEFATREDFSDATSVPASQDGDAGTGDGLAFVVQRATALTPSTTYFFHVVAANAGGSVTGPTESFQTLETAPPGLPNNRVYEKASPSDKFGADITIKGTGNISTSTASESGDAVSFLTVNTGFDGEGGLVGRGYISRRGSSGWVTRGIAPPIDPVPGIGTHNTAGYEWLSPDLSKGVLQTVKAINPGDGLGVQNLYLRDMTSDTYHTLTKLGAGVSLPEDAQVELHPSLFSGASAGAEHVVFESIYPLTLDTPVDSENGCIIRPRDFCGPYEWVDGEVRYFGVLPNGEKAQHVVPGAISRITGFDQSPGQHLISEDGSRIYFTVLSNEVGTLGGGLGLYVRVDGSATAHVSLSEAPGPNPSESNVRFELAKASDGSVAFFTDTEKRTSDAAPGRNLYRWDAFAPAGSRLTSLTTADPTDAGVLAPPTLGPVRQAILGASDDATKVYFVATGELAPGAVRDRPNVYLWQEDAGVRFVADGSGLEEARPADYSNGNRTDYGRARVTPDGRYLLFESRDRLTAYNNAGFTQLYLYDAQEDTLNCVSCNPRALSSQGNAALRTTYLSPFQVTRNLSANGRRVFFNSTEPLVAQDTNGKQDVYQWEDGRLSLISSGSGKGTSEFIDASVSGDDVFLLTGEPLVRSDADDLTDVYDARVGGRSEPPVIPGCLGDECQGTPTAPPAFDNPSTSTFRGQGNPRNGSNRRCGEGKRRVRRDGRVRCVKKRKRPRGAKAQARNERGQARAGR